MGRTAKVSTIKARAAPVHPSFIDMIVECIVAHPDEARAGVSRPMIKKFLEETYKIDITPSHITNINRAIARGAETQVFTLPKGPSGKVKLAPKKAAETKENQAPVAVKKTTAAPKKKPRSPHPSLEPGPQPQQKRPLPRRKLRLLRSPRRKLRQSLLLRLLSSQPPSQPLNQLQSRLPKQRPRRLQLLRRKRLQRRRLPLRPLPRPRRLPQLAQRQRRKSAAKPAVADPPARRKQPLRPQGRPRNARLRNKRFGYDLVQDLSS
ncbi:hypothetical protein BDV93DRAFT_10646 [Ceratobasidium sp. AG-I]|nr:hypothetical protein BDV93DRAFT_10646 [Ceratobasidium sp. AG-I]